MALFVSLQHHCNGTQPWLSCMRSCTDWWMRIFWPCFPISARQRAGPRTVAILKVLSNSMPYKVLPLPSRPFSCSVSPAILIAISGRDRHFGGKRRPACTAWSAIQPPEICARPVFGLPPPMSLCVPMNHTCVVLVDLGVQSSCVSKSSLYSSREMACARLSTVGVSCSLKDSMLECSTGCSRERSTASNSPINFTLTLACERPDALNAFEP
mmetsp:Transcript_126584/g.394054  ORF Transcript_126584/g.394054 Transcript_126584/m.394054 type:complete len:212 (-) Transcript_126584:641-1276(-)